ncbi:MAG: thioredoxin [Candidatus Promineifilaceae bacterium]
MQAGTNVIEVSEATFAEEVVERSHQKPVVVDFWAAWCGPCRMLGPVLERLAAEPDAGFILAKVDVDANPRLAMEYGIQGIPAVKAFRDGRVANQFVGALPEPRVRHWLAQVAPKAADSGLAAAEAQLGRREWAAAERLYSDLLASNGAAPAAQLGLARALLGQGKGAEARAQLEAAAGAPAMLAQVERLRPLADYLARYAEPAEGEVELTPVEATFRQAAQLLGRGQPAAGLEGLLDVLRHNKNYRDGKAKAVVLALFELLGDADPLTQTGRRQLASILF